MSEPAFIAVDWGTTSFRLWLLSRSGAVLAERRSAEGMTTAMRTGFAEVLQSHLDAIGAPDNLPVLVCGMAGARQGWVEAGYIDVPASLSAVLDGAVRVPGQARDVRILPGLAQRDKNAPDVMRGEETQLLGALASADAGEKLVCMPGTHSKWVTVKGGDVTGFATFMTGELFEVISKQTILSMRWPRPKPLMANTRPSRRPYATSTPIRSWRPTGCSPCAPGSCCMALPQPTPRPSFPAS